MVNDNKLLMIKLGWLKPTIDARLYSPEVRKDTQKLVNKCYRRANKKEAWIEERLRSVY